MTPIQIVEVDQTIAESGEHIDNLIETYRRRAAEFGHEQSVCDLTALLLSTEVLATNAHALLAVAVARLAVA